LAFLQAWIDHQSRTVGISANVVAETIVALRYGRPLQTDKNLDALIRGERLLVFADPRKGHIKHGGDMDLDSGETGEKWRDQNVFRPITDDYLKALRRVRTAPVHDKDNQWLAAMSVLWIICLQGDRACSLGAERLADAIGEGEYFRTRMRPVLIVHASMRDAGLKKTILPINLIAKISFPAMDLQKLSH
jgi:hypothetical protein